jgi:Skp family chaperone for outer membrane proteins
MMASFGLRRRAEPPQREITMTIMKNTITIPAFGLILVLCSVVAYQAAGNRAAQQTPARSPVVATVNLHAVLEGLEQRAEAAASLQQMGMQVMAESQRREEGINAMHNELEQLRQRNAGQPTDPAAQALEERIVLETLNFRRWQQLMSEKLDVETALLMMDLYRAIREAIAEMAGSERIDLVVLDDSQGELSINPEARVPRETQIKQQILSRNVLYAGSTLDITSEVITRMNNKHRAGR